MVVRLHYTLRSTYSSLQTIKVVDNDSNKQVEHKESAHNDKNDEVEVSTKVTLVCRLLVDLKRAQETR